jgi:hypothetical protein
MTGHWRNRRFLSACHGISFDDYFLSLISLIRLDCRIPLGHYVAFAVAEAGLDGDPYRLKILHQLDRREQLLGRLMSVFELDNADAAVAVEMRSSLVDRLHHLELSMGSAN